jgi:hypothetical protein
MLVSGCSGGSDCDESLFEVSPNDAERRFETTESCLRSEFGDEFVLVDLEPRYQQQGFAISTGLLDFGAFYRPASEEDPNVRIEFDVAPEASCFGFRELSLEGGETLKVQERDDVTIGCLEGDQVHYAIVLGGAPRGPEADSLLVSVGNALIAQGAVDPDA